MEYEVTVTKTTATMYFVEALNKAEAEDKVQLGKVEPDRTKDISTMVEVEEA